VYRAYTTRATSGRLRQPRFAWPHFGVAREKANLLGFRNFCRPGDRRPYGPFRRAGGEVLAELKEKTEVRFREGEPGTHGVPDELWKVPAPELAAWTLILCGETACALYDFDEEALRPYFPVERVIRACLKPSGGSNGIRVVEESGVPVWHPDVGSITGSTIRMNHVGAFLRGLVPTPQPRSGAWMDSFITGVPGDRGFLPIWL